MRSLLLFSKVCAAAALLFFALIVQQTEAQSLPVKRTHAIPLDSAKKFISYFKNDTAHAAIQGGFFFREIFEDILASKNVAAIRYYYAKTNEGVPTLVLVGVDTLGRDITTATIAEKSYPCPPYCDGSSLLLKQPK